jgi:hypothetical protein
MRTLAHPIRSLMLYPLSYERGVNGIWPLSSAPERLLRISRHHTSARRNLIHDFSRPKLPICFQTTVTERNGELKFGLKVTHRAERPEPIRMPMEKPDPTRFDVLMRDWRRRHQRRKDQSMHQRGGFRSAFFLGRLARVITPETRAIVRNASVLAGGGKGGV